MSARDQDPDFAVTAPQPLAASPQGLAAWVAQWRGTDIPVLDDTAVALEAMRANEDAVDANLIGGAVATDPLMTLKLLVYATALRSARELGGPQTVTGALVMTGISPFFRAFGPQPTVEQCLQAEPAALAGFRRALTRARRAANFALSFALHCNDHHAAELHLAALLHDFAELLLWLDAPVLALRMQELQRVDPGLRNATVQRVVLQAELPQVQLELLRCWRAPELLLRIAEARCAAEPAPASALTDHGPTLVALAVRLARHTAGWADPAIAETLQALGALLGLPLDSVTHLLQEADA